MKYINTSSNRGFTLIELLVVISIIGLLSSIVLASLKTARDKATQGAIKASLTSIRNEMELYYLSNSHYGLSPVSTSIVSCTGTNAGGGFSSGNLPAIISSIYRNGGQSSNTICSFDVSGAGTQAQKWSFSTQYKDGGQICIDSTSGRIQGGVGDDYQAGNGICASD